MNAITSYLRHWIVTGILLFVAKHQWTVAGTDEMANGLALCVVGTGTWALVKFAPGWAKQVGLLSLAAAVLLLPSCTPGQMALVKELPVKACVLTQYGQVCYSSKAGISTEIDLCSGK